MNDFIEVNMIPLIFVYGQVYFIFGLAIALQQRGLSNFRLARHLWLLAAFGIVHGTAEWGHVFIPIQSAYLSAGWIQLLDIMQQFAWAVSYAFLLQFAVIMIAPRLPLVPRVRAFVRWYAPAWSAAVMLTAIFFLPSEIAETWIRHLLGFPAAALTAAAFIIERRNFKKYPSSTVKFNLTMTAAAFGLYAVLTGLIVPAVSVWPLSQMNYQAVYATTGLPIQFFRALTGLFIAIFAIRTLSVFDLEVRRRLESAEKEKTMLEDRHRIARDLHDGAIQDIYGASLQLEAVTSSLQTHPDEAAPAIRHVIRLQNTVITDIRRYIYKLYPDKAGRVDLEYSIRHLVDEFRSGSSVDAHLELKGDEVELTPDRRQHVIHTVRECLSNVAQHAHASRVDIEITFNTDSMSLSVKDDGIGMHRHYSSVDELERSGGGLGNIAERVRIMGADLSIAKVSRDSGTAISLCIPYQQAAGSEGPDREEASL